MKKNTEKQIYNITDHSNLCILIPGSIFIFNCLNIIIISVFSFWLFIFFVFLKLKWKTNALKHLLEKCYHLHSKKKNIKKLCKRTKYNWCLFNSQF